MKEKQKKRNEELQAFLDSDWNPEEAAEFFAEQLAELLWRHWLYTQSQKKIEGQKKSEDIDKSQ